MATGSPSRGPRHGRRGLGFRSQIAILIAVIIFCAGTAATMLQYLGVYSQFADATGSVGTSVEGGLPDSPSPGEPVTPPVQTPPLPTEGSVIAQELRQEVLGGTIPWLVGIQVALALLSAAAGWWLSGRLLRRVAEVVRAARRVSTGDLSSRLRLTGPRDEITDLGDTFDEMLDRLEESFLAHQQFIANASHELRTPISSARLALDAPLHQGLFEGAGARGAELAIASLDRASDLLDDLLDLATSRNAGISDGGPADLAGVVEEVVEQRRPEARARAQSFDLRLQPALALVSPGLFARAVDNLVTNAIRHGTPGTIIGISTSSADGSVRLAVTNDGEVLEPETAQHLVRPFERGRQSRMSGVPGSGIGLAIVAAVVERHGGALSVQPRPEGGLVVCVTLPAAPGLPGASGPPLAKRPRP